MASSLSASLRLCFVRARPLQLSSRAAHVNAVNITAPFVRRRAFSSSADSDPPQNGDDDDPPPADLKRPEVPTLCCGNACGEKCVWIPYNLELQKYEERIEKLRKEKGEAYLIRHNLVPTTPSTVPIDEGVPVDADNFSASMSAFAELERQLKG